MLLCAPLPAAPGQPPLAVTPTAWQLREIRCCITAVAWSVCVFVCLLVTSASCAKAAEPIELTFHVWTRGTVWEGECLPRLKLFGLVARVDQAEDHSRDATIDSLNPPGNWRRPRGRPRQTWQRIVSDDLKHLNLGLHSAHCKIVLHSGRSWKPQLWNSLPEHIVSASTLQSFKRHLKTFLLQQPFRLAL